MEQNKGTNRHIKLGSCSHDRQPSTIPTNAPSTGPLRISLWLSTEAWLDALLMKLESPLSSASCVAMCLGYQRGECLLFEGHVLHRAGPYQAPVPASVNDVLFAERASEHVHVVSW